LELTFRVLRAMILAEIKIGIPEEAVKLIILDPPYYLGSSIDDMVTRQKLPVI